jgi:hypothetical protein
MFRQDTPDAIVAKINDGINKALQNPECSASLRSPISRASRCRSRTRRADEGGSREADE